MLACQFKVTKYFKNKMKNEYLKNI